MSHTIGVATANRPSEYLSPIKEPTPKSRDNAYESFPWLLPENQREADRLYLEGLNKLFASSTGTNLDKLRAFPKFVPVSELGRFLAKSEIFRKVLTVCGSVVECGVYVGGGLMTWATLSAILEPLNHVRHVIGFDTFDGFPSVQSIDRGETANDLAVDGGMRASTEAELRQTIRLFDMYRPLGHIPKVELVKGDACMTIPEYIKANPHLVVSMVYLDFDIFEPTRCALETLLPRMPRGAVIAFDELNIKQWPGETMAVLKAIGIRNLKIERLPYQPQISYTVLD